MIPACWNVGERKLVSRGSALIDLSHCRGHLIRSRYQNPLYPRFLIFEEQTRSS
jgi:hypothetical protein